MKLFSLFNKKSFESDTSTTSSTQEKTPTLYVLLGGENGVRRLANTFYDTMETAPEAKALLAIHPMPLTSIRQRFFEYLSGWFGGPPLFEQKYGHPRLRARHLPYPVTPVLKQQWMFCMRTALEQQVDDHNLRASLLDAFNQLAEHMINRQDPAGGCPAGVTR